MSRRRAPAADPIMNETDILANATAMGAKESPEFKSKLDDIWGEDYKTSLNNMRNAVINLEDIQNSNTFKEKITEIALDICKSKIKSADSIGKQIEAAEKLYNEGEQLIKQGEYYDGFYKLSESYVETSRIIDGQMPRFSGIPTDKISKKPTNYLPLLFILIIIFVIVVILIVLRRKQN